MNPVEDALIRRLDARHAFAKVLRGQTPRNRRILVEYWRRGSTFQEIGQKLRLSTARVGQIHAVGFDHVREALKQRTLSATSLRGAPPGFDKAAFFDHMRWLIRRREEAKRDEWRKELWVMSRFVKMATPEPPRPRPSVAPPPAPPPSLPPLVQHLGWSISWPVYVPTQNIEPWFDPRHTPTADDLREITKYAVGYYAAALRVPHPGLEPPRKVLFSFECAREADIIAGGLYQRRKDFPVAQARFTGIRVTLVGVNVMFEIGFE